MRRGLLPFLALSWLVSGCAGVGRLPVSEAETAELPAEVDTLTDQAGDAPSETDDTSLPPDIPQPNCVYKADGTLKYLTIDLSGNPCVYTLAQAKEGITFHYRIIVEKAVHNVVSQPLDAGHCDVPGTSGLRVFEKIHGNGQAWCFCDEGLCKDTNEPVEIEAGEYADSLSWDGNNWNGPSDTGNEPGPPFPPGEYTLVLRAEGTYGEGGILFAETATMQITLVE
ncbi:MAG: hypothetical protein FJ109_17965 [Deltaproteobacteria bacterium]|nr:hypothetical protein [Deltaproteobacteria bacterium]